MSRRVAGYLLAALPVLAAPASAVEIDGRIDPSEWEGALHVTDFRKVQPLTGEPGTFRTEAWVLATPRGLAVAFRSEQPPHVPRTRQKVRRDFEEQVDRVNLFVDFDGDGRTGYAFTVSSTGGIADEIITDENRFNSDWDGPWLQAVSEDEAGWSVELLVPWHTARMRPASGGGRTLKICLSRVVAATGERVSWPAASYDRPRFLSDFAPVEVPAYTQSLLAVTPYVSSLYDAAGGSHGSKAGLDVFWKPEGRLLLAATVNPDFGQVESDDLVINFSATETFISDKRPFFTENQGLFDLTTPSDNSQQLYTRRVGSIGGIKAAAKLLGGIGRVNYGLFSAVEGGPDGRSFHALRVVHDFEDQNFGAMLTRVDQDSTGRRATVLGIDHNWRPTARLSVRTRLLGSRTDGADGRSRDIGATLWADYEMDGGWRQQWIAMHFGDRLELNDFGYLSRNSLDYLHWEVRRRFTGLPESSRYSSVDWRWRVSTSRNGHGIGLGDQFRIVRQAQLRNGGYEFAQLNINAAGTSDLLLFGNGLARLPPYFNAYYDYSRPRRGDWAYTAQAEANSGGLAGNRKIGMGLGYEATYFASDAFSIRAGFYAFRVPDWLVWQSGNLAGGFERRQLELGAGVDWAIDGRNELRVKLQAIALDARNHGAWRFGPDGRALAADDPVGDFTVRNLGLQVRYRYELAPLSHLYVVYARGGYQRLPGTDSLGSLLGDSLRLRDDEQLLVKLNYRFEL